MNPLLSIGIVTFNQHDLCRNLMLSLRNTTPVPTKIIVWNNGAERFDCPNGTVINAGENLGYIIPHNRMAKMTNSLWHVVANDDVLVEPGWFEQAVCAFDDPRVAVVGPQSRFGYLDANFHGAAVPAGAAPDYIEGWWQVWNRQALDRFELFDELNLSVATCEDADACLRVREHGWQIRAVPMAVKHLGQASKIKAGEMSWGTHNHAYCRRRWNRYLAERRFEQHVVDVRSLSAEERRIAEWKHPFSRLIS